MEEGEEGEAGPPREEEEEEGVLHQGQGLEEEEEVDPPTPKAKAPRWGSLRILRRSSLGLAPRRASARSKRPSRCRKPVRPRRRATPRAAESPGGRGKRARRARGSPRR